MSEVGEAEGSAGPNRSAYDYRDGDGALVALVDSINGLEESVAGGQPITLFVSDTIVTGEIVPAWQWFDEQAPADDDDDYMTRMAKNLREPSDEYPRHVHLKNATIVVPPMTIKADLHWRGRIAHVSGWVLGRMQLQIPE